MINSIERHYYHTHYRNYLQYGIAPKTPGDGSVNVSGDILEASKELKKFWGDKAAAKNRNGYESLAMELQDYLNNLLYSKTRTNGLNATPEDFNQETLQMIVDIINESGDIFKTNQNLTVENLVAILSNTETAKEIYRLNEQEIYSIEEIKKVNNELKRQMAEIENSLKTGLVKNQNSLKNLLEQRKTVSKKIDAIIAKNPSKISNQLLNKTIKLESLNKMLAIPYFWGVDMKALGTIAEYVFTLLQTNAQNFAEKKAVDMIAAKTAMTGAQHSTARMLISTSISRDIDSLYNTMTKEITNNKTGQITIEPDKKNKLFKSWKKIILQDGTLQLTNSSAMTTDISLDVSLLPENIQSKAKELGLERINESLKNYSSRNKVAMVSGAPLTSILNLDDQGRFSMHYLNFISSERGKGNKRGGSLSFQNYQMGLKSLFVVRSLFGIRNSSDNLSTAQWGNSSNGIGANEFIVVNDRRKRKVFVYSTYKILDYILDNELITDNAITMDVPEKGNQKWHGEDGFMSAKLALHNVLKTAESKTVSAKLNYTLFD